MHYIPRDPLDRLAYMMVWDYIILERTTAKRCMCGSCEVYRIAWTDVFDEDVAVESESLHDVIGMAWHQLRNAGKMENDE